MGVMALELVVMARYFAMDGTPYYHNSQSNTVQWELPIEFKNPSAAHTVPQAKGENSRRLSGVVLEDEYMFAFLS